MRLRRARLALEHLRLHPECLGRLLCGTQMVPDVDLAQPLEIGNTFEVEDAPDQLVGVAHLTNRFFPDFLPEVLIARVFAHPRVDEVGREDVVQHRDDLIVTSHGVGPRAFNAGITNGRVGVPSTENIVRGSSATGPLPPKAQLLADATTALRLVTAPRSAL